METKKEFTKKDLETIILFGTIGKTFSQLAIDLGVTPDQLRDERYKNPELDKALRDYEYNANQFYIEKMMKAALSNIKGFAAEVYFEAYKYLSEKQNSY